MKASLLITIAIALLWSLFFTAGSSIRAQKSDSPRSSVTINTDLVVMWAQITNHNDGTPVKGLEINDFVLREDDKQQQISLIKEGQPLSVVILMDGAIPCNKESLGLGSSFRRSREALRQLGDDAEIALMVWYSRVAFVRGLTRDWSDIADHIADRNRLINASFQAGHDYDIPELPRPGEAIYQAARYLEKAVSPERRKVIIIINTPQLVNDTHLHTAAEVRELLEKTRTTVYGLYQTFDKYRPEDGYSSGSIFGIRRPDKKRRAGGTIEEFAKQTGGSVIIGDQKESDELLIKLIGLIRSSYTIGYYPENSNFDGRFRRISLELSPQGKAKAGKVDIKTRNGYLAIRPSAPAASEARPER